MNRREHFLICKYCGCEFLGWRVTQEYCCRQCSGFGRRLTEADFWTLVDKSSEPQGCWLWTGKILDNGSQIIYGRFGCEYAHRYAYRLYHADECLASDDFVCHSCDNGLCVSEKHLFRGTAYDNSQDARMKGRISEGSKHPGATTTEEIVRKIWDDWQEGTLTMKTLAQKYEVTFSVVMHIVSGKNWKHVTQCAG